MGWGAIAGAVIGAAGSYFGGKESAKAADDAGEYQYKAAKEAREQLERLNKPWIRLGQRGIDPFEDALYNPEYNYADKFNADPYGFDYLSNNPLFQAAVDNADRKMQTAGASQGKLNSGGMVDQLFQNYLAMGDQFYGNYLARGDSLANSHVNRMQLPVTIGQNAANFQGVNAANLITQGGNALAAGTVGSANAWGQGLAGAAQGLGAAIGAWPGLNQGNSQVTPGFGGWSGDSYGYW